MESTYQKLKNEDSSCVDFELPELVEEEAEITKIFCYRMSKAKLALYWFMCIVTVSFWYLINRWLPKLKIKITMKKTNISSATHFLIYCKDNSHSMVPCEYQRLLINNKEDDRKVINFRLFKYYFEFTENKFKPIKFKLTHLTCNQIHEQFGQGIKDETHLNEISSLFGKNNTDIPPKPIPSILVDEILSPFYIFQIYSITLWMWNDYKIYAGLIIVSSIISIATTVVESVQNMRKLREISQFESKINVFRGIQGMLQKNDAAIDIDEAIKTKKQQVSSHELVPGDIVEVPENDLMPCDLILLNGSSIMNESMITGESVPVLKNALPYNNFLYNPNEDHKTSTLFAGTKCIETRYYNKSKIPVLALVAQTGFNTLKGQLLRSILYPKEHSFKFYKDAMLFVLCLFIVAAGGFSYSVVALLNLGTDPADIFKKALDIITISVPPALPTCITVGISFSIVRKKQIFCISPQKINISGKINIMCFDKTGTLTEEGLDMYGIRPTLLNPKSKTKQQKRQN